jgi:hypothetical protein
MEFIKNDFIPCHVILNQALIYFNRDELCDWVFAMKKKINGQTRQEVSKPGMAATCIFSEIKHSRKLWNMD